MKLKETRTIPAYQTEVCVKLQCDLCGKVSHLRDKWPDTHNNLNETTVSYKTGHSYPEGGSGQLYEVDICPDCFTTRLIPWLECQGATVEPTEWDY